MIGTQDKKAYPHASSGARHVCQCSHLDKVWLSGQVQIHQACRRSTVTLLAPNTAASACACLTHVSSDPIRSSLSDPWDPHASKLVTTDTVHTHVMLKHMLTEARHPQLQRFRWPALITPAQCRGRGVMLLHQSVLALHHDPGFQTTTAVSKMANMAAHAM